MTLEELRSKFDSAEMSSRRKAYCGRDFKFKSEDQFESAVYALQWEMKADFVGQHSIRFRMDRYRFPDVNPAFPIDGQELMPLLENRIQDYLDKDDRLDYDLSRLTKLAMQLSPSETLDLLKRVLEKTEGDQTLRYKALLLLEGTADWRPRGLG
jgi:hypothetical protein